MTDPVWPTSLPQYGTNEVSGSPQSNVVSFQPEVGPTIDRRRSSSRNRILSIELPPITEAQYLIFREFFEETLKDGVLPFAWVDPMTKTSSRVKFVQKETAYTERRVSSVLVQVSFQLAIIR